MILLNLYWQRSSTNFTTGKLQTSAHKFFHSFPLFIFIKPDSLEWKITFQNVFQAMLKKQQFRIGKWALLWIDVEQRLNAVPKGTFANSYKISFCLTIMKLRFFCFLPNLKKYQFQFLCFHYLKFFCFQTWECIEKLQNSDICVIEYIRTGLIRYISMHLHQITSGFVDVSASKT